MYLKRSAFTGVTYNLPIGLVHTSNFTYFCNFIKEIKILMIHSASTSMAVINIKSLFSSMNRPKKVDQDKLGYYGLSIIF